MYRGETIYSSECMGRRSWTNSRIFSAVVADAIHLWKDLLDGCNFWGYPPTFNTTAITTTTHTRVIELNYINIWWNSMASFYRFLWLILLRFCCCYLYIHPSVRLPVSLAFFVFIRLITYSVHNSFIICSHSFHQLFCHIPFLSAFRLQCVFHSVNITDTAQLFR